MREEKIAYTNACLHLAIWAIVRPSSTDQNPSDWLPADQAWLASTEIDTVLKLEKSANAVGVYVI